ncbi:H-NS family nucleoid-associated regulatory protein [Paraburkholderia silvatlantica]|uniref:H-NS histone family protein n=1 Tax=Paraburkholderia silvatlantica TaxID=321895 RepID=UPI003753782D
MRRELPLLRAQLADLNARIERARLAEMDDAIARCKAIIDEFQLTAWDLGLLKVQQIASGRHEPRTFKPRVVRTAPAPKYRDPATGETWSGRGRPPRWLQDENDWDSYLIRSA